LGGGSGIDIVKLARDLTDVEKLPAEEKINASQEATQAKISAFAVLKFNVQALVDQFNALNDASELATPTATSSDVGKVSVLSTDGSALSGIYEFSVSALATEQRNISNAYLSKTQSLNGGSGFTLTVTTPAGGTATNIAIDAGNDNPQGVVNAINAAGLGVTAVLVAADSAGSAYRIALQGQTGASNSFEISSTLSDSDLGFHDASNGNLANNSGTRSLQNPGDASLTYNGVGLTRSSNVVTDVLPGLTVSLNGTTSGGDTVNLNVVSDRATLKTKLQDLVTTYNDVQFALNELSDPDSEEEEVGGALARDLAVIRTVRDTIYKAVTQDSSTPSGDITGLRDIGVTLTGYGELQFSETAYDAKASANFSDISTMLSAGTDNQSRYDGQSQGLAIDAIAKLEVLTDSIDGIFAQRTESARKELSTYSKELIDLEARMDALYERYLSQFTVMETLVKQLNSTRESLTDTWSNMGNFNK
ncbi:MAG: flagellar filament capping protein FliD, partial [Halieaceae bacterium]